MLEYIKDFPLIVGVLAAIIHVLSGPDHLAAVGPIALKQKNNSWLIGLFWGLGHNLGMVLIGVLFFYFREFIPVEFISAQSEKIVGFILILIGLWVFIRLFKIKKGTSKHSHIHLHKDNDGETYAHYHDHDHMEQNGHEHVHSQKQSAIAVLGVGTLHGFAGVSHFIGLLPTLAFAHRGEAVLYLTGFAGGTIISMILFSAILGIIGEAASSKGKFQPYYYLNVLAASAAIFVGLFWIYQSW
jgi:hypothetical protein